MTSPLIPLPGISRRNVVKGGLTLAVGYLAGCAGSGQTGNSAGNPGKPGKPLIGFQPVPRAAGLGELPVISADYEFQVLIPWGEPLDPDGPSFSYPPSAADQAEQVGIGHDGMHFFAKEGKAMNVGKTLNNNSCFQMIN